MYMNEWMNEGTEWLIAPSEQERYNDLENYQRKQQQQQAMMHMSPAY